MSLRFMAAALIFLAWLTSNAAIPSKNKAARKSVTLPALGTIVLAVPKTWTPTVEELITHHKNPIHISQLDFTEPSFRASIKVMRPERKDPKFTDLELLAKQLLNEGKSLESHSKEKKTVLEAIKGQHPGHRFTLTNPAPKAGEFKIMKRGAMTVRDMVVSYVIYQNEPANADASLMQNAIENLALARSMDAKPKKHKPKPADRRKNPKE